MSLAAGQSSLKIQPGGSEDRAATDARLNQGHLPELDGVRGLAILLVLLSHAVNFLHVVPQESAGVPWTLIVNRIFLPGWGGVDLFFTLSGFLITGILLRARTRPRYFSSFYARRALRIFPIYYLALTVMLLGAVLLGEKGPTIPVTIHERLSYFLYLQNWPIFWSSWAGMGTLWGAYWSLAVEEQFYMVWPSAIRFFSVRTMFYGCLAGFVCGFFERRLLIQQHLLQFGVMQFPLARLDGLFLGAAIALYRELSGRVVPMRAAWAALSTGAVMYLWIVIFHGNELGWVGEHLWRNGVTAFALLSAGLIVAIEHRLPTLRRVLTVRPLLLMGKYSYGMYVYHLSIFFAMQGLWDRHLAGLLGTHIAVAGLYIALAIGLATGVAALSFHVIEMPFVRLKRFFPSPAAPV